MNVSNRPDTRPMMLTTTNTASRLSLYDKYGSVAYGVILKIIPQPQQAQEVLIDLFASPDLQAGLVPSANTTCVIVRLARGKALAYCKKNQLPIPALPAEIKQSELIFNLLFYQNQTPDVIAERLQIQRSAVFGAVREFFAYLLPS
nr:hypothetical protein A6C57_14735 [Fibrella sp. ES10-3-2-2]